MRQATSLLIALLLLTVFATSGYAQEPALRLRLEPLTVQGDLYSVAVSGDRLVAVGEAGTVVIWSRERLTIFTVSSTDLVSVSCSDRICVAVGEKGVLTEIDPHEETYRTYIVSQKDLSKVSLNGYLAAVAAKTEVLFYRVGGAVSRSVDTGVDLSSVTWSRGEVLASGGGRILSINPETGVVKTVAEHKMRIQKVYEAGGRLWTLSDKGLAVDGNVTLPGAFSGMEPAPRGFILYRDQAITFYDIVDRRQTPLANLQTRINHVIPYGSSLAVAGASGYLALVRDGAAQMLTAPAGDYVAAVSDGYGGVLIASKTGMLLHYREKTFSAYIFGDVPRAMTYSRGDVVILGSRGLWVFDGGAVKPVEASVKASDYVDIAPSSFWVTLVGPGGKIAEVGRHGELSTVEATSNNLLAATRGYAVGDKIAVMIGPEPRISRQDNKLVDVDSTACGAVAVSDTGDVVYLRKDSVTKSSLKSKTKLTTVSVNPRGAYVLAGGSKGELILYDGFNATLLPTALPEEVRAIAWIDSRAAIVATSKAVYRLAELGYPPPYVEVKAPRSLDVFSGSSRKIEITLVPRNGFSGRAEIPVAVSGSPYLTVQPTTLTTSLDPLCPAKATLSLSIYPEAPEGAASITLLNPGKATSIAVNIAKPGAQQQAAQLPITINQIQIIAAIGIVGMIIYAISRRRRKAPE